MRQTQQQKNNGTERFQEADRRTAKESGDG
jgi:hypothetical protein